MSGTAAAAATADTQARVRLGRWQPTAGMPVAAGEAAAPAYDPEPGVAAAHALLEGLDAAGLVAVVDGALERLGEAPVLLALADRVVSRLAAEALAAPVAEVADSVAGLRRLGRRMSAELHRRVAELDSRDAWRVLRCRSAADWLSSTLALTSYEARMVVETARVLETLPKTAARFAAGELDGAQVHAAAKPRQNWRGWRRWPSRRPTTRGRAALAARRTAAPVRVAATAVAALMVQVRVAPAARPTAAPVRVATAMMVRVATAMMVRMAAATVSVRATARLPAAVGGAAGWRGRGRSWMR